MTRLKNKIAIVVGAGQTKGETLGNGRATAIRFAQEGAKLFLVDKDIDSVTETLELCKQNGGTGEIMEADVRSEEQCKAIVERCERSLGPPAVLHNNVGIGFGDRGPTKITEQIWDDIFDTNLKSVMFICKYALPSMRAQRSGSIINISSIAAICNGGMVSYKASKAALNAYTHALATGSAQYGIRANAIMPGYINTPMAIEGYVGAGFEREELIRRRNEAIPLKQEMGSAWDVANAALFFASDESRFITGTCLPVDGGQSAMIGSGM